MKHINTRDKSIKIAIFCSILLLTLFFYLQNINSNLLKLESKWIAISILPLLVVLIMEGYINKIRGFGFELETLLTNPIGESSLSATEAIAYLPDFEKRTLNELMELPNERRNKIKRLSFILGKKDYYSPEVIKKYQQVLPNLTFIEIKEEDGKFIYLMPMWPINRKEYFLDEPAFEIFVRALENRKIPEQYKKVIVSDFVTEEETLIEVLPKVRMSKYEFLPVVSSQKRLLGIITTEAIEKKIADDVIAASKRR